MRLGEQPWGRGQAVRGPVAPLPRGLDLWRQLEEVLVQAEGEAATYLVALLFAGETCDGIVEGGRGRYDQAGVVLEAGGREDVGLDARVRRLGRGRSRAVEDEYGRVVQQLVCRVEERQVLCGQSGGLGVDYHHGWQLGKTSDRAGWWQRNRAAKTTIIRLLAWCSCEDRVAGSGVDVSRGPVQERVVEDASSPTNNNKSHGCRRSRTKKAVMQRAAGAKRGRQLQRQLSMCHRCDTGAHGVPGRNDEYLASLGPLSGRASALAASPELPYRLKLHQHPAVGDNKSTGHCSFGHETLAIEP